VKPRGPLNLTLRVLVEAGVVAGLVLYVAGSHLLGIGLAALSVIYEALVCASGARLRTVSAESSPDPPDSHGERNGN
jgi:hypothetical protein